MTKYWGVAFKLKPRTSLHLFHLLPLEHAQRINLPIHHYITPKIYFFLFYDTAERKLTNIFVLFYRRVRTLYACLGENDGELSFEPNQIITNGNYRKSMFYSSFSSFLHFYNFSFLFIIVYAWKSKTKQVNRFYTIQPY